MRRCPQSQEECEKKRKNTQRKRGGCEEDHLRFSKTGSKKNRKRRKNPPHRSGKAISERDPKSTEKNDTAAHPPRAKFARAADTLPKRRFSKRARFCSPRGFLTFETQFRQNFEHRTVQNSNLRKKLSSRQVRKKEPFRHAQRDRRGTETRNGSETPCFVAFRACPPQRLRCHKTADQSQEKRVSGKGGQENAQKPSKRAILQKGRFRVFSVGADFPRKTVTPFRTIKQAVSEDPDRLLTLPGPLINS